MLDHSEWARRCCALSKSATDPEVIEQLRLWALEFANAAKEATRRARLHPKGRRRRQGVEY